METHILFFILAGLLIAILVGASIWSARREKSRIFSNTFSTRPPSSPINNGLNSEIPTSLSASGFNQQTQEHNAQSINDNFVQAEQQEIKQSIDNIKIRLPGEDQAVFSEDQTKYNAELSSTISPITPATEPAIQIDLGQTAQNDIVQMEEPQTASPPQMITLYVVAAEGQQFYGNDIVRVLDNLGFLYGEYSIFHRHIDNASSPVLFSVANMMQPGIFDLNTIDQFSTVGLTFFMQLPSAGNDLVNLRLMMRTVEHFAKSIGGFILDEQHQLFNENTTQAYLSRVGHTTA